jgi:hypothetical protein
MMSLPSRVVISLTFLTDSAKIHALPILVRGFASAATIEFKRLLNNTIGSFEC